LLAAADGEAELDPLDELDDVDERGLGDPDAAGLGVVDGDVVGRTGSTESRGSVRGATTTTPTRSSALGSTKGTTEAYLVSWPGVPLTDVIVPTGMPGG
jgi:hypothetical protein